MIIKRSVIFLVALLTLFVALSQSIGQHTSLGLINTQDNRVKHLQHDFYLEDSFHIFQNTSLYWYMYLREADIKGLPDFTHGNIKKVYFLLRKVYTVVNFGHVEQWIAIPHNVTYYEWTVPPVESTHYFISFLVFFETLSADGKTEQGHSVLIHSNIFTIKGFSIFLSLGQDLVWHADEPVGLRVTSFYPIPSDFEIYAQLRKVDSFISHALTNTDNNVIETVKLDFDGEHETLIYFPAPANFSNRRFNGSLYNFVLVCREYADLDRRFYYRVSAYSVTFRMQGSDELGVAGPCVELKAPPFAIKEPVWRVNVSMFHSRPGPFAVNEELLFIIDFPLERPRSMTVNTTVALLRNCDQRVLVGRIKVSLATEIVDIHESTPELAPYKFIHAFADPGVYCWSLSYGDSPQLQNRSAPFSVRGQRIDHIHDNTVWHPAGKNGFAIQIRPGIKVTKFRMEVLHNRLLVDTENAPFGSDRSALICETEYVFEQPYQLPNRSMVYFNALMGPTFNRHMYWKYGYYIRLYVTEQFVKSDGEVGYFTFPLAESERFTIYPDQGMHSMDSLHLKSEASIDSILSHQKLEPSSQVAVMDTRLAVFYLLVTAIVPLADAD